jgi:FixJ family two-component response regulator
VRHTARRIFADGPPPTIAIVDDDDGVRTSLTSFVRSLGYDVRSYGSAPEFLNDQDIGDPDCMISDIQMPQMTGDQLQAELTAAGRVFPIIFVTAFPTEATRSRVMAAGACAYLDKPADGDTIARCLAAAVEHRRAPEAPPPRG